MALNRIECDYRECKINEPTKCKIKYSATAFFSPPFSDSSPCNADGVLAVCLKVERASNWSCYIGAAPADCTQSRGLNKTGLGFAIDGTVRFQKAKIQGSSSSREYKAQQELCLTYEHATKTVTLWRNVHEHLASPEWSEIASFQGVPPDWRFACGCDLCVASFELLPTLMPPISSAASTPAPPPTASAVDVSDRTATEKPARVASSGTFADAQQQAAATTIQGVYHRRLSKGPSKAGVAPTGFEYTGKRKDTSIDGNACKMLGTNATVFCSAPFSSMGGGQQCVRLQLTRATASSSYVGAAPADCDPDTSLHRTGVGFAKDGTLRFQKTKVKSSAAGRAFDLNEVLTLTYDDATQTLELWRDGIRLQEYSGVPSDWRFAIGIDYCRAEFDMLPPLSETAVTPTLNGVQWASAAQFETEAVESLAIEDGRLLRAEKGRYPRRHVVAFCSPTFESCIESSPRIRLKWMSHGRTTTET